jgi:hypothetical protein
MQLSLTREARDRLADLYVRHMPYELSFRKQVSIKDKEEYFNECCIGGDVVVDQLISPIREQYSDVQSHQEDWGWFIWFRKGDVHLAVDIFTDDHDKGEFRIHIISRKKRWLFFDTVIDTPELDTLRTEIESRLAKWIGEPIKVKHVDSNYTEIA